MGYGLTGTRKSFLEMADEKTKNAIAGFANIKPGSKTTYEQPTSGKIMNVLSLGVGGAMIGKEVLPLLSAATKAPTVAGTVASTTAPGAAAGGGWGAAIGAIIGIASLFF